MLSNAPPATAAAVPAPAAHAGFHRRTALATLVALLLLLAWDASGIDLALARLAGGPAGFPLREHWLLAGVLHEGGRRAAWLVVVALSLGVWWPFGPLRRIGTRQRMQLAVSVLAGVLVVSLLKGFNRTSCPWDLAAFGGVARWLPHWLGFLGVADGGPGHCFPAGHASSGFAFVAGWFAFRRDAPAVARRWLVGALLAGVVFGLAQQARGAHLTSHTLWTAWLCWTVAWLLDLAATRFGRRSAATTAPAAH